MSLKAILFLGFFFVTHHQASSSEFPVFKSSLTGALGKWLKQDIPDRANLYVPANLPGNGTCKMALVEMMETLEYSEAGDITWAHRIVDSMGKYIQGGAYLWTPQLYGHFDPCVQASSPEGDIRGKFCRVTIRKTVDPKPTNQKSLMLKRIKPNTFAAIDIIDSLPKTSQYDYSTCMPDDCQDWQLQASVGLELLGKAYVENVECHTAADSEIDFTAADIGYISMMCFLFFMISTASIVDFYLEVTDNKELRQGPLKFFLVFSAYTNIGKVFYLNTKQTPGNITCLHGMRVLSMTWVIYCHQQTMDFHFTYNFLQIYGNRVDGLLYQAISNGYPSVDSFFFMSGLLISYNVLKEMKKTGKFNIVLFYLHRFLRLIPPMAVIIGFYATVMRFFFTGGIFGSWRYYWYHTCRTAWWRDLTFTGNLIFDPVEEGFGNACLGQGWYLGADTQMYLVAPLLVLPLFYYKPLGEFWLYLMTLASCIVPAAITYKYGLPPTGTMINPNGEDFMKKLYLVPWCRAGPWIIGLWAGYVLHNQGHKRFKLAPWQVVGGWTVAIFTGLTIVFGLWDYNTIPAKMMYDQATQIIYAGFHRTFWGLALFWVVFACHNGYGGFINDFLSLPSWQPISRMTFTIYLTAYPLQFLMSYTLRVPSYFDQYVKMMETVAALVLGSVIALLVTITIESPIVGLERLLLKGPSRTENNPKIKSSQGIDNAGFRPENGIGLQYEKEVMEMSEKAKLHNEGLKDTYVNGTLLNTANGSVTNTNVSPVTAF